MAMSRMQLAVLVLMALTSAPWPAVAQSAPATAAGEELIAVLNLRGVQTNEGEVAALTNRLREVLLKSGRFTLVDRSQTDAILNEQALQQTGCTEQECAVQVGRILGVRKIVAGEVVKVSDQVWLLSAIMVDVETSETLRAESIRHRGDFFALMDQRITELGTKLSTDGKGVAARAAAPATAASAPPPPHPARGDTVVPRADSAEMVVLPAGQFQMGREAGLFDSNDTEPVHTVTLRAFRMDKHEVSQERFEAVMRANPSEFADPRLPVHNVTWHEASEFCEKAGKRLPTEAEWEYAARAGTTTAFSFGLSDTLATSYANLCGNGCRRESSGQSASEADGWETVAPAGSFKPNPWGLYDMHGNMAEWVSDWYGPYRTDASGNPVGPPAGATKVVRGGSWRDAAGALRSATREHEPTTTRSAEIGFRCVADGAG